MTSKLLDHINEPWQRTTSNYIKTTEPSKNHIPDDTLNKKYLHKLSDNAIPKHKEPLYRIRACTCMWEHNREHPLSAVMEGS